MQTTETTLDIQSIPDLVLIDLSLDKIELSDLDKVEEIKKIILEFYIYDWEQVNKNCRDQEIVLCRYLIMYFIKLHTPYSLKKIGSFFVGKKGGVKDHSTVIHAIQTIKDHNDTNKDFNRQLIVITKKINRVLLWDNK